MNHSHTPAARGFTLIETVIAIGVLAVLLTGFMMVFAPAAAGIKQSINVQDADRLASTLEQELVTLRPGDTEATGFEKAFNRLQRCKDAANALLIYQYRGALTGTLRTDRTPVPVPNIKASDTSYLVAGKDYMVVPMVRLISDAIFLKDDLPATEGGIYLVKCTPLVFKNSALTLGTAGTITDLKGAGNHTPATYPEAVIPFAAEFYSVPAKAKSFFTGGGFATFFNTAKTPVFTRNLAVRR